jgi:Na+/proline symporter/nitrogen-specific signal transduction histidine kinase
MLQGGTIFLVILLYMGILFGLAYYGDKRADQGRSIINNPVVYALSMGVYCTAWTFYGSVGRAATTGVGFLPIYLGPTLMAALWWFVLRKIIRISKLYRITSIADLIASRYGKSQFLGGLATVIAVVGIVPYISLQLEAVATSFNLLWTYPDVDGIVQIGELFTITDTAFYVAIILAAFAILFGTRHLDLTERHEGLVAAIAFESVVKLLAFLAVGIFVTFFMYDGFGDLFARAGAQPELQQLLTLPEPGAPHAVGQSYGDWAWLTLLSMMAILFLPRQFQIAVVENADERHLNRAIWLFPLYLLVINIFVLPIAFGGLLRFPAGQIDADTFVLTLPLVEEQAALTLFAFIGGFSAATGMVIVATIALSTMVSNDLIVPLLINLRGVRFNVREDLSGLLLGIRRVTIVVIVFLAYAYLRLTGDANTLVSIGLISFAAVAQFAPAVLGGIYWKGGTRTGAITGLTLGFLIWLYTLSLPSLAPAGRLPTAIVNEGLFGLDWTYPYALFGFTGLGPVAHSLFWSLLFNAGAYCVISLLGAPSVLERSQASRFVDVFKQSGSAEGLTLWRGSASVESISGVLQRFLGLRRTENALRIYARRRGLELPLVGTADAEFVQYAETLLAGAIGAASANVAIASVVKEEALGMDELMRMLDETSQVIAYSRQLEQRSRQLEQKSIELEAAYAELQAANERLQELDLLKDDFISTVTHELRTPLTSIRAFSEILYDNPTLDMERRSEFLAIILRESERLTRLINQVLDLSKIESGAMEWNVTAVDMIELIQDSVSSMSQVFSERNVDVQLYLPPTAPTVHVDEDRIRQVILNLLSNASKFCDPDKGRVIVQLRVEPAQLRIAVSDNGPGIPPEAQAVIFEKFRQVNDIKRGKPQGTGLGLPISREIVAHFGGELSVLSAADEGATFTFTLPLASSPITA